MRLWYDVRHQTLPSSVMTFMRHIGLIVALALSLTADAAAAASGRARQDGAPLAAERRDPGVAPEPRVVRSTYADLEVFPIDEGVDGTLVLRLTVRPEPALHVYAATKAGFLGPTVVFPAEAGIEIVKIDRPEPEVLPPPSTSAGALVYRGPFTLRYDVRVRPGRRGSPSRIGGTLRYQACTDRVCYKPETVRLEWIRRRGNARAPGK